MKFCIIKILENFVKSYFRGFTDQDIQNYIDKRLDKFLIFSEHQHENFEAVKALTQQTAMR